MLRELSSANTKAVVLESVPRMAADLALVHGAMIISLAGALVYHVINKHAALAEYLVDLYSHYYLSKFVWLSLLFPAVFAASGLYSRHRSDAGWSKFIAVMRAGVLATLVFLAANYMLFREEIAPRSVLLLFCLLEVALLTLARFAVSVLSPAITVPAAPEPDQVLIVGGAGYIGSVLARMLLDQGRRVRVLDKLVYGEEACRELRAHPRFELIEGDCRNIQCVVNAVKGVDAVVHLAAIVGDPACDQDHATALEINFAATRMLIELAKGNGVSRLIFASSCSVYGETDRLMTETSAVHPISLYAQTKVDSEKALLAARSSGFHPTVLRLATVFGHSSRPRFDLVLNLLTAKAHRHHTITIYNGDQWRPFIHVRDVARGIISVLNAPANAVSGEIFNLGDSAQNFTLAEIARKIEVAYPGTHVEHIENTDRRNYRVSFEKVCSTLNFHSAVTVDEGILELRRMLEQGLVRDYNDVQYHNQRFLQAAGSPRTLRELDVRIMAAFAGPDIAGS